MSSSVVSSHNRELLAVQLIGSGGNCIKLELHLTWRRAVEQQFLGDYYRCFTTWSRPRLAALSGAKPGS
jgi:hypothetical protein